MIVKWLNGDHVTVPMSDLRKGDIFLFGSTVFLYVSSVTEQAGYVHRGVNAWDFAGSCMLLIPNNPRVTKLKAELLLSYA